MCKSGIYIGGEWHKPSGLNTFDVVDPGTECLVTRLATADTAVVDLACQTALKAAANYRLSERSDRRHYLEQLLDLIEADRDSLARCISLEMGAPLDLARQSQVNAGTRQLKTAIKILGDFHWRTSIRRRKVDLVYEPIGVCALITPWNWPLLQVLAKVAAALATGCTIVLKPSELSSLSAIKLMELVDQTDLPSGVVNMLTGTGNITGKLLAQHPIPRLVSFTGSRKVGIDVARQAALTVKRVVLELGGKSPCLVFADADLERAVSSSVRRCFHNSGQSCNAPSRLLVERSSYHKAMEIACRTAQSLSIASPQVTGKHLGPVASLQQFENIQRLLQSGVREGATLLCGGPGKPDGLVQGYFVRPTVFSDVNNEMTITREEIFGPVLCMMPFDSESHALSLANDTDYGLAAYLYTNDNRRAKRVAEQLECGMVSINGASHSSLAPFGGVKQSGNGREYGEHGFLEYLEIKAISGSSQRVHKTR